MTALNWELAPEHVLILSDSLALAGEDHRPAFMTTKVFPLPHMSLCIAGTGAQPLAERFWAHANSKCVASDVAHLNEYAADILRDLWLQLHSEPDYETEEARRFTSTVYIYGWSVSNKAFIGFAYRSANDFVSEPLRYGIAAKPAPNSRQVPDMNGLTDFVELLLLQKQEDRERPRMERIGIGGEIIMTLMVRDETGFTAIKQQPIFKFDDYDDDWELILARLPENQDHPFSIAALARDP